MRATSEDWIKIKDENPVAIQKRAAQLIPLPRSAKRIVPVKTCHAHVWKARERFENNLVSDKD